MINTIRVTPLNSPSSVKSKDNRKIPMIEEKESIPKKSVILSKKKNRKVSKKCVGRAAKVKKPIMVAKKAKRNAKGKKIFLTVEQLELLGL